MVKTNPIFDLVGDALPPLLAQAHQGTVRLFGTADVEHGGFMARILAGILGLPEDGKAIPLSITGDHRVAVVEWRRSFDEHRMDSHFERRGDFLAEHFGPVELLLKLDVKGGRLVYTLEKARMLGFDLPAALRPRLNAWEGDQDGRYAFEVDVGLPALGRLIRYSGQLDLDRP